MASLRKSIGAARRRLVRRRRRRSRGHGPSAAAPPPGSQRPYFVSGMKTALPVLQNSGVVAGTSVGASSTLFLAA